MLSEPRMSTPVADRDLASVHVDELIVERYDGAGAPPGRDLRRKRRAPRVRRGSLVAGLTALAALSIATVLLRPRYRRELTPLARLLLWLGLARLVARLGIPL